MASSRNKQKGFGLSAEIADRIASKFDIELANDISNWFAALGLGSPNALPDNASKFDHMEEFQYFLMDGIKLCKLANILTPGAIRRIHSTAYDRNNPPSAMKAMKMQENISNFNKFCISYGLKQSDCFSTADLYDGGNVTMVQSSLFKLGGKAKSKNFNGPTIGNKEAQKNVRVFSDEVIAQGKAQTSFINSAHKGAGKMSDVSGTGRRQIIDNTSSNYTANYNTESLLTSGVRKNFEGAGGKGARQIIDKTSQESGADYSTEGLISSGNRTTFDVNNEGRRQIHKDFK